MKAIRIFHRFSFRVIAGLIFMLFFVGTPFFFLFLNHHRSQLLATMEISTTNMSRMLTQQLEISMLAGRHGELDQMVTTLAAGADARSVMILDPGGKAVVSSDRSLVGKIFQQKRDPGCVECHTPGEPRHTISLADSAGRAYYRNVNVIRNVPACHACHDSKSGVNGLLVMDFSQETLQRQFRSSVFRILVIGGTMLMLTIGVLYVLLNHLVIKKLRKFSQATEEIGKARFGTVNIPGRDEFSHLASSFNVMSERMGSAMRETKASKEYLENVINNIDDEIVVVDRRFNIVTANAAFFHNRQEAKKLVRKDDPPLREGGEAGGRTPTGGSASASELTFRDGRVHKVLQSYIDGDGNERFVEAFSSPLRNQDGEVHQAIEVRRDITERKMLEANLAHSERLVYLGLLASGLAHEINNPLASISTFVDGLKRRLGEAEPPAPGDRERLERSLGLIQREIERAKDVTRRLLILAQKSDSGRSLVDLNQSLLETVSLVRYEASRMGIRIDVKPGPGIPTFKASESQIRQVFLNLLLNSLQAGHSGGYVRCRTWHEDGTILASVEDDGCGIETADLQKIFDPFFSKRNLGQGTGLGLFICKTIISSLGGNIAVASLVGEGSTFTIELPAHK